ncbi:tetratricopeptide repeat protein [Gallaecimonas sp. GXIMD4217]|uniref:tetratricopeptide repeat protein n=1 Tax=Gallaecimonas sp. GXIMD4217 TaxID=3131927 RepID=UPI00311AD683
MSNLIQDVNELNAQQLLVDASMEHPVLVQFWAQGSEPCAELSPILEKLVNEYQGRFTLARVDCQTEYGLVQHFRIQTLPTLYLIKDGQPVDGLAGPQTEDSVRALLDKHLPDQAQQDLQAGKAALAEGRHDDALQLLLQAKASPRLDGDAALAVALARTYLALERLDDAEALLDAIPLADQDGDYKAAVAELELKKEAADTPAIRELQARLEADPGDDQARLQLALQLHQVGRNEEALASLLALLKKELDFGNGEARKLYQDILTALGQGNALAAQYRRALYSLLY